MIVILLGESGCGKTSIANVLCENYNFEKIVTYTTRPMRKGEVDGIDYHFISNNDFNKLKEDKFFLETSTYNDWQYGSPKNEFYDSVKGNKIAILTPSGYRNLLRFKDKDLTEVYYNLVNNRYYSFYIKVPRRDRLIKILERGDDIEEAYRRNLSDVGMFDGVKDEVDYTICNYNYNLTPSEISQIILSRINNKSGDYQC